MEKGGCRELAGVVVRLLGLKLCGRFFVFVFFTRVDLFPKPLANHKAWKQKTLASLFQTCYIVSFPLYQKEKTHEKRNNVLIHKISFLHRAKSGFACFSSVSVQFLLSENVSL